MNLKLDWCSHKAARYAVEHWHYSKCMPAGKTAKIGVWEDGIFIGAIVFAMGSNAHISKLKGKTAELARVALKKHKAPVTRILAIAMKIIKKTYPKLDAIVSYADLDRHEGTIYKAGNWIDEGVTIAKWKKVNNILTHPRSLYSRYGTHSLKYLRENVDPNACEVETAGKRRFVYYLIKRASSSKVEQPTIQSDEGGAVPTDALHLNGEPYHGTSN